MKVGAVAVDSPSREIYWVDRISNSVERASLDGTNNELVSNSADGEPHCCNLDERINGKLTS